MPILERYYLAMSLLLKAGSGRLSQDALERQCQLMAQRMALLYEINSPEFFDRALFGNFIEQLRARHVLTDTEEGKLAFQPAMLEAIVADAQLVFGLAGQVEEHVVLVEGDLIGGEFGLKRPQYGDLRAEQCLPGVDRCRSIAHPVKLPPVEAPGGRACRDPLAEALEATR